MTRFLMSLDEAVDLVMFAFNNGDNGDLFVQKSPACTIGILAKALLKIFDSNSKIEIIGIRHGEKIMKHYVLERRWLNLLIWTNFTRSHMMIEI